MMGALEKLIDAINLPKRIVDDAELFLKRLLGPGINEAGQMIADQVRYRRFKNQVVIFSKANELLNKNHIEPKQVNLKMLHPIMEYSSLEEDETLQDIWARFIANVSSHETDLSLSLKCIDILKNITPEEVRFLDYFFALFKAKEKTILEEWQKGSVFKDRASAFPDSAIFATWEHREQLNITSEKLDLYVDRLTSLGLMKYEQPILRESNEDEIMHDYFSDEKKAVKINSYELETSERIHFTAFGLYFVRACKYGDQD
jgi:hypothetical protein